MDLTELLRRPGLPPRLRLLVEATCAIWPADWERLSATLEAARTRAVPRADLEETLLQAALFYGFPRIVTAFDVLTRTWPTSTPRRAGGPAGDQRAAGEELFARIYGPRAAAVRKMLEAHHGELHDFVLEAAYGRILSRPGLPVAEREVLAVAALASSDQPDQLVAHARGALRVGADEEAVLEAARAAGASPAAVESLRARMRR